MTDSVATADPETVSVHPPPVRELSGGLSVNPGWLVKLRTAAVIGQLLTIVIVAWGFHVPVAVVPLLAIVLLTAATNVVFHVWCLRIGSSTIVEHPGSRIESVLGSILLLDLLALTLLLGCSGGIDNPFALFYLVNLALSAVLLSPGWAWTMAGLAGIGFLALLKFRLPFPLDGVDHVDLPFGWGEWESATVNRMGQLTALATCATVITYFVTRVTRDQRRLESELRVIDQRRARSEKLEALGTLAGGAAHELASPLSTIAVVAKELERRVKGSEAETALGEDLRLMRDEVARCRRILDRMSARAGQMVGEVVVTLRPRELIEEIVTGLRQQDRVRIVMAPAAEAVTLDVPKTGLAQALRGIVQNGLDASHPEGVVTVTAEIESKRLRIEIRDEGPGMPPDVMARAGEPFFTTKGVGAGMGLGLFLARSVIERLGGAFELRSEEGRGTVARVLLPLSAKSTGSSGRWTALGKSG